MNKSKENGTPGKEAKSESDTKVKDHHAADDVHKTPKKRRKVNHGTVALSPRVYLDCTC
jgi:hypothetical protein